MELSAGVEESVGLGRRQRDVQQTQHLFHLLCSVRACRHVCVCMCVCVCVCLQHVCVRVHVACTRGLLQGHVGGCIDEEHGISF